MVIIQRWLALLIVVSCTLQLVKNPDPRRRHHRWQFWKPPAEGWLVQKNGRYLQAKFSGDATYALEACDKEARKEKH